MLTSRRRERLAQTCFSKIRRGFSKNHRNMRERRRTDFELNFVALKNSHNNVKATEVCLVSREKEVNPRRCRRGDYQDARNLPREKRAILSLRRHGYSPFCTPEKKCSLHAEMSTTSPPSPCSQLTCFSLLRPFFPDSRASIIGSN